MSSMIFTAIGLAVGGYCTSIVWKELKNGTLIGLLNIIISLYFCLIKGLSLGLTFSVVSIITMIIGAMCLTRKDGSKPIYTGDYLQKAFDEKEAARARANPTLAMIDTINMNIRNNSSSRKTFFTQQQKDLDEWTEQRINTIGDINAGRAPNGTNGVWLKD